MHLIARLGRGLRWGGAPVALLLLAACAAGAPRRGPEVGGEVRVQVQNDLVPPRALTVRLVSSTGQRILLGQVAAGQTRTLVAREPGYNGTYRLVAETGSGSEVASNPFNLEQNESLVWQVRANLVRFTDG